MGGGSGVRRRDGQHWDTWQAQLVGSAQLRIGPVVLVLCGLATWQLRRINYRVCQCIGHIRRAVPVPA